MLIENNVHAVSKLLNNVYMLSHSYWTAYHR